MSYANTGVVQILVIDDDTEMRALFTDLLLTLGHQAIVVESAEEGLEQLPFQTFDVAFLDHQLPGMDGLIFGQYLQKNNPHMKIALVTGDTEPRLRRVSREHDIVFIQKPFQLDAILNVIEEYKQQALARQDAVEEASAPNFAPLIQPYFSELSEAFDLPEVPERIQKQLFQQIRDTLAVMRLDKVMDEAVRVKAFAGLLAAQVLGLKLPQLKDGSTPWETYDRLMAARGGRIEFSEE